MTPAPTIIKTPSGTKLVVIGVVSTLNKKSSTSIYWQNGSSTSGGTFEGPKANYILTENVFGEAYIVVDSPPPQFSVSFDFGGDIGHQPTIKPPVTSKVGPEGSSTQVQVTAFDAPTSATPTTITILFQGSLHGFNTSD